MSSKEKFTIEAKQFQRLIQKLKKESKSMEDAKFIFQCVKHTEFFTKFCQENQDTLSMDAILQLCRMLTYELSPARSVVIREGDLSNNKFYIILEGRVTVYVRTKKTAKKPSQDNQDYLGEAINILYSGSHFGEKVLLDSSPDARRNASIYINEDTHFLILQKHFYISVFKWFGKAFIFKSEQLAKLLPQLDKVNSRKTLDSLMYYFKDERHHKGDKVLKEGQIIDTIYFMAQGTCSMTRFMKKRQTHERPLSSTQYLKQVISNNHILDSDLFPEQYVDEEILISTQTELGVFGDEILLSLNPDNTHMENSAQTKSLFTIRIESTSCLLYTIKLPILLQYFPPQTVQGLRQAIIDKLTVRDQIFQEKVQIKHREWEAGTHGQAQIMELQKFLPSEHPESNRHFLKNPQFYNSYINSVKQMVFKKQKQQTQIIGYNKKDSSLLELPVQEAKLCEQRKQPFQVPHINQNTTDSDLTMEKQLNFNESAIKQEQSVPLQITTPTSAVQPPTTDGFTRMASPRRIYSAKLPIKQSSNATTTKDKKPQQPQRAIKSKYITLQQFITMQKSHPDPMQLYERVEDPFEFAQPNQSLASKKLQFANFIQTGIVKIKKVSRPQSSLSQIPEKTRRLIRTYRTASESPKSHAQSNVDKMRPMTPQSQTTIPHRTKRLGSKSMTKFDNFEISETPTPIAQFSQQFIQCDRDDLNNHLNNYNIRDSNPSLLVKSYSQLQQVMEPTHYYYNQNKSRILSGLTYSRATRSMKSISPSNSGSEQHFFPNKNNDYIKKKFLERTKLKGRKHSQPKNIIDKIFKNM